MRERENILHLIPQRPPFVFVDAMETASYDQVKTSYCIAADCPLVTDGVLSMAGLMENAAQTCAARAGWIQKQQNQKVRIGYIGALKQMSVKRFPKVGETIETTATLTQELLNISMLECITKIGEEVSAQVTIKLALAEE